MSRPSSIRGYAKPSSAFTRRSSLRCPRRRTGPRAGARPIASFVLRFRTASLGKPQQALDVADHSARRLFETLPIHASMRELDEEVVYGAVRFRMIAVSQEMQRRMRRRRLGRDELLAASRT